MEFNLEQNQKQVKLHYAVPLTQLIESQAGLFQDSSCFLIIVNQANYDAYYEKVQLLFGKERQQFWYVCPNGTSSGSLTEFEGLLGYALEMQIEKTACVVAFGDEGAIELGSAFASLYLGGLLLVELPTTLNALEHTFLKPALLSYRMKRNVLAMEKRSAGVFLEARFLQGNSFSEIRKGFSHWVQLAVGLDALFFKSLIQQFKLEKSFHEKSLIPYLTSYLNLVQASYQVVPQLARTFGAELQTVIQAQKEPDFLEENSLISGLSFSLVLSVLQLGLRIDLRAWFDWLQRLGYQVQLPAKWLTSDLASELWENQIRTPEGTFVLLPELGKLEEKLIPAVDLLAAVEEYRRLTDV